MSIKQDYHDNFRFNLHGRKIGRNLPLKGALELTHRCNLKCVHCYTRVNSRNRQMNFEQICGLLKELKSSGCLWLLITGGEPLLRPDFIKIYSKVKEYGFLPTIFTNGTLINEELTKFLAEYKPLTVEVSLYALGEKQYKTITKVAGAYKKCMEGIALLVKYKIPFRIKMPLLSLNRGQLSKVKKYSEGLGVSFRCDGIIHPCLDGSKEPHKFSLSPKDIAGVSTRCQNLEENSGSNKINNWLRKKDFYYYTCGAGVNFFSIDPYGKLKACMLSAYPGYDVLNKGFVRGWQKYFKNGKAFEVKGKNGKSCLNCEELFFCDVCPGWWKDRNGRDRFQPQEHLCNIAKLRYKQAESGLKQ